MEECICNGCGSVHQIKEFRLPVRDEDSLHCQVCGEMLKDWNGATGWQLVRTDKMKYRGCDIEEQAGPTFMDATGTPRAAREYLATPSTSAESTRLKESTLRELTEKIDEFFAKST